MKGTRPGLSCWQPCPELPLSTNYRESTLCNLINGMSILLNETMLK